MSFVYLTGPVDLISMMSGSGTNVRLNCLAKPTRKRANHWPVEIAKQSFFHSDFLEEQHYACSSN